MSLHCKVIFPKNPLNVFYTGQSVRGYVQLSVEQKQPVSSIRIEISGIVISKLKENNAMKVHHEDCFNHRISILGKLKSLHRSALYLDWSFFCVCVCVNFSWRTMANRKNTSFSVPIQIAIEIASIIRRDIWLYSIQIDCYHWITTSAKRRFHWTNHNSRADWCKWSRVAGFQTDACKI